MQRQFVDYAVSSMEVRKIVSEEVRPLLTQLERVVERLDKYYKHDIEFQQKLLSLLSKMLSNQQITSDAFYDLDSFIRKEFFWEK